MKSGGMSPDEFEQIAKRASELTYEKIHADIGRNTLRAAYWAIGACLAGFLAWLGSKGLIK